MNTRPPIERTSAAVVLSAAFNNDATFFSVGLNTGFRIFNAPACTLKTARDFNGGIGLVQMMGKTNMMALVGGGRQPKFAQNKVIIWDEPRNKAAIEITTLTTVHGVQLARDRIVVVLQNSVRVYAFSKPPHLMAAYETADNVLGLCCLAEKIMAFPGRTAGQVQLVEISTGNVSIIPAHSSALKAMKISPDGELLATASDIGTLIRVFATSNCARLAELRRGIDPAVIFSLGFSPSCTMLACTSDKSTLHIFDVPHPKRPPRKPCQPNSTTSISSARGTAAQGLSQQRFYAVVGHHGLPGSSSSAVASDTGNGTGKWGILGKIPLMPRMFSDVYSFATARFETMDDQSLPGAENSFAMSADLRLSTAQPPKGIIGWTDEESLLVIGAGCNARWERFVIREGEEGKRLCIRDGWKRYLGD